MYKQAQRSKGGLKVERHYEGERIEEKVRRITTNREPIGDGAPLIYTDRKDGVQPDYDIRTDRMEYALEAMDKKAKDRTARREERHKKKDIGAEAQENMKKEEKGETGTSDSKGGSSGQSTQGK